MHERRVALLMNRDSSHTREVCAGVLGYVAEGARWFVHLSPSDPRALEPLKEWQPDGVIAHLFNEELADGLAAWGGPVVNITSTLNDRFPMVEVKHDAVGVMAAEHLLNEDSAASSPDPTVQDLRFPESKHSTVGCKKLVARCACHVEDLPLRDQNQLVGMQRPSAAGCVAQTGRRSLLHGWRPQVAACAAWTSTSRKKWPSLE